MMKSEKIKVQNLTSNRSGSICDLTLFGYKSSDMQLSAIRYLASLVLLLTIGSISNITAQSCDYRTGIVTFNADGQNTTDLYTTQYILTDQSGEILQISDQTQFEVDIQGFYMIYGVNFKNDTTVDGLTGGSNIHTVSGDCIDISDPMSITVCEELDPCNYCLGEEVVLAATGGNDDPDFTTQYILTDSDGNILVVQDNPDFGELEMGLYVAFAVNYETAAGIEGLEVDANLMDISGTCFDIGEGYIVGVCQALNPTIFFDLQGCDITQQAILVVGEQYDSYLWSTGSTQDFIIVDANEPATYTVEVALASGCIGRQTQIITGEERAIIGDYVWEDLNGDGIQDPDEPGINGVTVNLYADFNFDGVPDFSDFPSCITTTINNPDTGEPGYYIFNVYQSGYIVEFIGPDGYTISPRGEGDDGTLDSDVNPNGLSNTINVSPGQVINDIDAGFFTSAGLGGVAWEDLNGNGVQDEGEPGLNDVVINLYDTDNMLVATTVTSTNPETGEVGYYCFDGIAPTTYFTEVIIPDTYVVSPADRRADDDIDSDLNNENGPNTTANYTLQPGEKIDNVDYGLYVGGRICGIVWKEDAETENNVYDDGLDSLIANSQLQLISIDNGNLVVQLASTDENGAYCFEDVPMGSYQVRSLASGDNGDSFVSLGIGDDELVDNDIDPNTTSTEVFFLMPSEEIEGLNAGLRFGVVPIELISFAGEWNAALNVNELTWATALEINNDKFEIERAVGAGDFVKIGEVAGNGTTALISRYEYLDKDIATSTTYYYRLKQVDYDGGYAYSDIIAINVERNNIVVADVYPNPAKDVMAVGMTLEENAIGVASIYDVSGREIKSFDQQYLYKGKEEMLLDVSDLETGHYLLSIKVGTIQLNKMVIITR